MGWTHPPVDPALRGGPMTVATTDFIVADLALAAWGRKEIAIAEG